MAQPFDVLQPGAAAEHVVGQVQHVVGLVVGQVHLQQVQLLVDLLDQPEPGDQPVHRGDPAEAGRVDVAADLVADLPEVSIGAGRAPVPGLRVPRRHPAPAAGRVPPTLLMRYLLHHKGLPCWAALESQTQAG